MKPFPEPGTAKEKYGWLVERLSIACSEAMAEFPFLTDNQVKERILSMIIGNVEMSRSLSILLAQQIGVANQSIIKKARIALSSITMKIIIRPPIDVNESICHHCGAEGLCAYLLCGEDLSPSERYCIECLELALLALRTAIKIKS